jgi:uncharacterized protein involved in exopolysaccharide biosynthesis
VSRKFLEAFFRHKRLLLLPPLLIPLIVGTLSYLMTPLYYEGWTAVWIGQPAYIAATDQANPYLSPAQNQANRMTELLKTQSFLTDVARRTSLAPLTGSTVGQERLQALVLGQISMQPSGNNLLAIRYRSTTQQLTLQVLQALIDAYTEKTANDRTSQGTLAISFYESRVQATQDQAKQSADAVRRYVQASRLSIDPSVSGDLTGLDTAATTDPQLKQLQSQAEFDQKQLDDARASLDKARFQVDAADQGQDLSFQVIDPPRIPTGASRDVKKLIIAPIAALLVGLIGSGVLLVIILASDRSIRSETDLVPPVRVLGIVPKLKLKRVPKRDRSTAIRRAIGFAGGSSLTLPSPQRTK